MCSSDLNISDCYIIRGEKGSGQVCINGAASHLISKGDLVIIVAYCQLNETEAQIHKPKIVHVNSENRVTFLASEEPVLV